MASEISARAEIDPRAKIGENCKIFPFAYIEGDVEIGDNCIIFPFVSILNGTRMGSGNKVHQGSVVGALPQDFNFRGEKTECIIGNNNIIRENVVINRATFASGETRIGDDNFIMEGVHISHDTVIDNDCVIGYGTKIAGNCHIQRGAILSSNVIANPGVRVGTCAMVQSGCRFSRDIPPYIVAAHNPIKYAGVNATVLTNAGVDAKVQNHLANAYRLVYGGNTSLFDAIMQIEDQVPQSEERDRVMQFLRETQIGVMGKL